MHLVVPMAGLGQRFREEGYLTPKPLIPVAGLPMIVRVIRDLPACERQTFIIHPDHVRQHAIDLVLQQHFPQANLLVTPGLTQGQACSVRLASHVVEPDEEVLVAACDNTHLYDAAAFAALRRDAGVEAAIWTYRHDPRVLVRPESLGWVRTRLGTDVVQVSCKRPISAQPLEDHAITGCFWFRHAGRLFDAIDRLVARDERVNREFYLDQVPNVLLEQGRRAVVFEVIKYIGWGTPHDLRDFEAWQSYFDHCRRPLVRAA